MPMNERPDDKQPESKAESRFRSRAGGRRLDLNPDSSDILYPPWGEDILYQRRMTQRPSSPMAGPVWASVERSRSSFLNPAHPNPGHPLCSFPSFPRVLPDARLSREDDHEKERSWTRLLGEISCRIMNVVLALAALLMLLPLMLIVAVLIRLDSAGPVIFRQRRVGLDRRSNAGNFEVGGRRTADLGGRPFTILKFRTMEVGAEMESGPVWARKDDPRATRVGRVLRATRMDEIPQFLNVLRGDMAIVGPRPERPRFVLKLREQIDGYRHRQRVLPGITGWAQVNRGYDQSLEDVRSKVQYDLEYVRRRSLWFDVKIMFLTIPVVLSPSRTYGPRKGFGTEAGGSMIGASSAASRVPKSHTLALPAQSTPSDLRVRVPLPGKNPGDRNAQLA